MTDEDHAVESVDAESWLFKADRAVDDVETTLAEAGIVTELRIPASDRIGRLEPGQACFLYVSGRHPDGRSDALVVGAGTITGVPSEAAETEGEPSGSDTPRTGLAGLIARGGDAGAAPPPTHVDLEVAIRPLAEPIHRGAMLTHAVLARSELFTRRDQPNPIRLTAAEFAALDGTFDLAVEVPDIPLVRVHGPEGEPSFSIDLAEDGTWQVTRFTADDAVTITTHATATEATASISAEVAAIAERLGSQVDEDGTAEDLEPLIVFDGGDGRELSIFKIAHRFAVFEVHAEGQVDPPLLGALDDIDGGMISLAGHLTGEHTHTHGHHDHGHHHGHDHEHHHHGGHGDGAEGEGGDGPPPPGGLEGWRRF